MDAANYAASSNLRRKPCDILLCNLVKLARELDPEDLFERETGRDEQDSALARPVIAMKANRE